MMLEETDADVVFKHNHFQVIDAEDSAYQMCRLLQRQGTDYVPVADPDEGNLVGVLSYLDMVNLLDTAARQFPHLFVSTIAEANIGTYRVVTCPETMLLEDALQICSEKNISSIPVVNAEGTVTGLYYKSDVSFITKNADPASILASIGSITVADAVAAAPTLPPAVGQPTPSDFPPPLGPDGLPLQSALMTNTFRTCRHNDPVHSVLATMMDSRVTRVVVVDEGNKCLGIVSIKDIISFYLDS
jgi:CBS domain-containing protein